MRRDQIAAFIGGDSAIVTHELRLAFVGFGTWGACLRRCSRGRTPGCGGALLDPGRDGTPGLASTTGIETRTGRREGSRARSTSASSRRPRATGCWRPIPPASRARLRPEDLRAAVGADPSSSSSACPGQLPRAAVAEALALGIAEAGEDSTVGGRPHLPAGTEAQRKRCGLVRGSGDASAFRPRDSPGRSSGEALVLETDVMGEIGVSSAGRTSIRPPAAVRCSRHLPLA